MATRADVARAAGVSEAAVSYALTGRGSIAPATRDRILAVMAELDYRPNVMARGLAGGRSAIIAVLFPMRERGISNSDLEYVVGAADAARELGYHLLLWPTAGRDIDEVRDMQRAGLIDGVLLMEVQLEDERIALLRAAGVEVGLIGRTADPVDEALPYADRDFAGAIDVAVEHLHGLGHREFAFLYGPSVSRRERFAAIVRAEEAFTAACVDRGLEVRLVETETTVASGRRVFQQRIAESDVTAIVTLDGEAGIGLVAAARDAGVAIPDQLSVVSIGTPAAAVALSSPELTTVSPPAEEIGRAAARMLIDRIGGLSLPPEPHLWTGRLVVRGTSGPPV